MKDTTVLDSLVGNASHISIVVHTHPDGDAIGSGTAMLCYLTQSRGKDAALIVPDSIPDSISFITRGAADGSILVSTRKGESLRPDQRQRPYHLSGLQLLLQDIRDGRRAEAV